MSGPSLFDDVEAPEQRWSIVHVGDPMPWERAGARIAGKAPKQWIAFYSPKRTEQRESDLAAEWRAAGHGRWAASVPLILMAVFVFARPSGHFGTGRNEGTVKPQFLSRRPGSHGATNAAGQRTGGDLDNLVKLVKDALSGVAYEDDGQVVKLDGCEKLYVDQAAVTEPQTIVELRPL